MKTKNKLPAEYDGHKLQKETFKSDRDRMDHAEYMVEENYHLKCTT